MNEPSPNTDEWKYSKYPWYFLWIDAGVPLVTIFFVTWVLIQVETSQSISEEIVATLLILTMCWLMVNRGLDCALEILTRITGPDTEFPLNE